MLESSSRRLLAALVTSMAASGILAGPGEKTCEFSAGLSRPTPHDATGFCVQY